MFRQSPALCLVEGMQCFISLHLAVERQNAGRFDVVSMESKVQFCRIQICQRLSRSQTLPRVQIISEDAVRARRRVGLRRICRRCRHS